MALPRSLVKEIEADKLTVGTMLKSMSVNMAEALSYTDIDFIFVDRQHGSPVLEELEHITRAAELNDMPVVVRVPRDDMSMITYLLDVGARGIILPQVESVNTIEEASSHIRYADGRSLGTTTRAAHFGAIEKGDYIDYVDNSLAFCPMIETERGLENVEKIAASPKTTAIVIGPGDLSFSLDTEYGSTRFREAVDDIFDVAAQHGCPVGMFIMNEDELDLYADRASFAIYGQDVSIVTEHVTRVVERLHR